MPSWNAQVNELFLQAREIASPEERESFLARVCAGDADLRAAVESLLEAGERAGSFLEAPATALTGILGAPSPEEPGTVIGHYKLLEQIGEGGFGIVYRA